MKYVLARSCSLADIWVSALKQIVKSEEGSRLSRHAGLIAEIKKWKPIADTTKVATGPQDISRFVDSRIIDGRYLNVSADRLLVAWRQISQMYHLAKESSEAFRKTSSPEAESFSEEREEYRSDCLYYRKLLNVRSESGVAENVLTRSFNKLLNGGYADQKTDQELARFLDQLADWLGKLPDPAPESQEQDPLSWLLEPKTFEACGFWPVPALAQVSHLIVEAPVPETARYLKNPPKDDFEILQLLIQLVVDVVRQKNDAETLWKTLFPAYLECSSLSREELIPKTANWLEKLARKSEMNGTASVWRRLLRITARLVEPQNKLLPPVIESGALDWGMLNEDDVIVQDSRTYSFVFGDSVTNTRVQILIPDDVNKSQLWNEWKILKHFKNPELDSQILKVRTQYWSGETLTPVSEWLESKVLGVSGDHWFHQLIENARQDHNLVQRLRHLNQKRILQVWPQLNSNGEPQWSEELHRGGVTLSPVKLTDPGVADTSIVKSVERFGWTPESSLVTVQQPLDPRFQGIRNLLESKQESIPEQLQECLQQLHQKVAAGAHKEDVSQILTGLLQNWLECVNQDRFDRNLAELFLKVLRELVGKLEPKWKILPQPISEERPWQDQKGVDIRYEFHDTILRNHPIRVHEFGLVTENQSAGNAQVVISSGREPDNYRSILNSLSDLKAPLNESLPDLLRALPNRIMTTSYESLCTDLFVKLWPDDVSGSQANVLNSDKTTAQIRTWFEKKFLSMKNWDKSDVAKQLRVEGISIGDTISTKQWEQNRHYRVSGGSPQGDTVEFMIRPRLYFETTNTTKEKAVLHVSD